MIDKNRLLVTHLNPKAQISEAFRMLRTNLFFLRAQGNLKTLLFTSALPNEGKTTIVVNLAVSFAQTGCKVLVIDADLRRPRAHRHFGEEMSHGFADYLKAGGDYKEYVRKTEVENLFIITSGTLPPNPAELLGRPVLDDFIAAAKEDFDIILFDCAPVSLVADPLILSSKADGTIIVAATNSTQIPKVKKAKEALEGVDANILGVVINKLYSTKSGYYYSKYRYYYGEEKKEDKLLKQESSKVNLKK